MLGYKKYMKYIIALLCCFFISSCAVKTSAPLDNGKCSVTNVDIKSYKGNILFQFIDNGCNYKYIQQEKNVWKVAVENGSFTNFNPSAEYKIKYDIPIIKKNHKEIIFHFAENGVFSKIDNNSFLYNQQKNIQNIPERKASYIQELTCSKKEAFIKGNGVLYGKYGKLYNGQKYIDIYDVSLKTDYKHGEKCKNINNPVVLRYPKRVRYFINNINQDVTLSNSSSSLVISLSSNYGNPYITDIIEEKSLHKQKVIIEASNNLNIVSTSITPSYVSVVIKGRYTPLTNLDYKMNLKGRAFNKIDINKKSTITELRLYNKKGIKENFVSIDKVDNKLIIYSTKQ